MDVRKLNELAAQVLDKLALKDCQLALAESVTGGYASHHLTNISGCSKRLIGCYVCYTAQAKNTMLGVSWDTINDNGTISPEVTEALVDGLLKCGADIGLAITGVAGQKLEGKPTGLVYISIGHQHGKKVYDFSFEGTRLEIKIEAVETAFRLLLQELDTL